MVVSCLHAPDDAHSKFDACPPCFFAVYDGHNGDLASEIAKSKVWYGVEPLNHTTIDSSRDVALYSPLHRLRTSVAVRIASLPPPCRVFALASFVRLSVLFSVVNE